MKVTFLGANATVTGSRTLIESGRSRVLVDCGMFQGWKQLRKRNWAAPTFEPSSLDAVLLTHAHLDHSGWLPRLVARGFKGRILATDATRRLCGIMLPDSARIQEEEAERANRKGYTKHRPALPLYTEREAEAALGQFDPQPFSQEFKVGERLTVKLLRAGHILGASSILVDDGETSILLSGDLGRTDDPITGTPDPPPDADHVLVESTYGDRQHEDHDPEARLGEIVNRAVARKGAVIVPAFAVGRAQLLLYHLQQLKAKGVIPAGLPIYLDSPMAVNVTELFCDHAGDHRLSEELTAKTCAVANYVESVDESKALDRRKDSFVLVSSSGMATGGRVVHHLKALAPDPGNVIVFAGYQAGGTRGADLVRGAKSVRIFGKQVPIRAEVEKLDGFSAHADSEELMAWLKGMKRPPHHVFINHGEPDSSEGLRRRIRDDLGWACSVPDYLDSVELTSRPASGKER